MRRIYNQDLFRSLADHFLLSYDLNVRFSSVTIRKNSVLFTLGDELVALFSCSHRTDEYVCVHKPNLNGPMWTLTRTLTEPKRAHLLPGTRKMCKWHQECGNKNGQLVLQNCSKTSLKVLLPTFKPFLQQISLLQVAWRLTSDWMKLLGSHAIHGSYVTCCETSLSWTGKTRNMYRFFCKKKKLLSTFCNNLFVAREVDSWVAKHARPLFNSFCSNVAN